MNSEHGVEEAPDDEAARNAEARRLAALERYGVLGTPPEPAFDRLTQLAARLLGMPVAMLNFVGADHQWTKSLAEPGWQAGVPTRLDRELAFCPAWAGGRKARGSEVLGPDVLARDGAGREAVVEVADATRDPRFSSHPFVEAEGGLRFYASALLRSPEGEALGSLCVLDRAPRHLSDEQREVLQELASIVMDEMEYRARMREWGRRLEDHGRAQGEQAAAARSEAMWRAMIENGSDIITLISHDGQILYQSPSSKSVLGFDPGEMVGTFAPSWIHPDDRAAIYRAAESTSGSGLRPAASGPVRLSYRQRHRDGSWRHIEAVGAVMPPGSGVEGTVISSRDVSARVQADEALALSEERHKSLFDHNADAIAVLDARGVYQSANPAMEELIGISSDAMRGQPMGFLMPEDQTAHASQVFAEVLRGRPQRLEMAIGIRDGERIEAAVTAVPIVVRGEVVGVYAIGRDITQRKKADESLRRAQAEAEAAREEAVRARHEAERANRAKSEFLSRMSHELRTPLNAILGFGQLLELARLPAREAGGVTQILKAGRHLLELINEVLDIARIETGQLDLHIERVDVRAALREAAELVAPLAAKRSISMREDAGCHSCAAGECSIHGVRKGTGPRSPDAEMPAVWVRADRQRLRQVLLNILSNAVKYNREGGWVEFGVEARGGRVELCICDSGRGIEPASLHRLFRPFERLGAEASEIEGIGLGLAVSKRLVEAMAGTIAADSTLGQGTCFSLSLPAPVAGAAAPPAPPQVLAAPTAPDEAAASLENETRVLYVEDNAANALLMEHIAASLSGVRLRVAEDAARGLAAAREMQPDVILLDLNLPDAPGLSIAGELRAACPNARLAIVSADATPEQCARAHRMGLTKYFSKPVDVAALSAFLRKK